MCSIRKVTRDTDSNDRSYSFTIIVSLFYLANKFSLSLSLSLSRVFNEVYPLLMSFRAASAISQCESAATKFEKHKCWTRHVRANFDGDLCKTQSYKNARTIAIFIGDPPIIVTIWNVVFANKSRTLGWIWMKLGRWGWGLKRLSLARFQRNRAMDFRESAKK